MRTATALLALLLASCSPLTYRLARVSDQLRLAPPKGVPMAKAPTPADAHRSLYGPYVQNGWVDLKPGMVLKAVTPVLPEGARLSNEAVSSRPGEVVVKSNVIGFATAFYTVTAAGNAVRVRFRDAEESSRGTVKRLDKPPVAIDERAAHWRLFFLVRESSDDRDITLAAAPSLAELDRLTANLGNSCREPGVVCVPAPRGAAFSAQVQIVYNGQPLLQPLGATLRELLRSQGIADPQSAPVTLRRLWRGRPTTVRSDSARDLLSLPLEVGDQVTARPALSSSTWSIPASSFPASPRAAARPPSGRTG